MGRQVEVDEKLFEPIYQAARDLAPTLGYEPPIFRPGKPAVQSVETSEVFVVMRSTPGGRGPETIAGSMWQTNRTLDMTFSVPERVKGLDEDIHPIIERVIDGLVDYYSGEFCNDTEQVYIDDVQWSSQIDVSNRTSYVLRLSYRFMEYPMREVN